MRFTCHFIVLLLLLFPAGRSSLLFAQWTMTNTLPPNNGIAGLIASGDVLFAGTFDGAGSGVYRSTDYGAAWASISNGLPPGDYFGIAVKGSTLFANASFDGVFRSTDNGVSWSPANAGLPNPFVPVFAVNGNHLFAGTYGSGVYLSTDDGLSWSSANSGMEDSFVLALLPVGSDLFTGTDGDGVLWSTDNGQNWVGVNSGLSDSTIFALAANTTHLFAATLFHGVFTSTNHGAHWTATSLMSGVSSFARSGGNIFAGTQGLGVYLTTDNGTSWTTVNEDLSDSMVSGLAVCGDFLFAATGSGVWRRPLSEVVNSVQSGSSDVPATFSLEQNYPNPFNPTTTFKYHLPVESRVSFKVYDVLGQLIETLVDRVEPSGDRSVQWDARNDAGNQISSGVYIYRLEAFAVNGNGGSFSQVKKGILAK